jgi:hypothetical protein
VDPYVYGLEVGFGELGEGTGGRVRLAAVSEWPATVLAEEPRKGLWSRIGGRRGSSKCQCRPWERGFGRGAAYLLLLFANVPPFKGDKHKTGQGLSKDC